MNEYFQTVVQVIPLDNFHEQVLLHGIFLATEMSPVTLTLIDLLLTGSLFALLPATGKAVQA